jgi:SAM-dependent methyltransferase
MVNLDSLFRRFRVTRMLSFCETLELRTETRVLDVGGTAWNWSLGPVSPNVTLVNIPLSREGLKNDPPLVIGDGRSLPFADGAFDVVFSNSVIEHVGGSDGQQRFADEIRRTGRRYWVQTPNRGFPIEPHLLTPFLQFLPKRWQWRIAQRFTVWETLARPRPDQREYYLKHCIDEVRLLGVAEMQKLFPDAEILRERFLGITKSIIAVRRDIP